MERKSILKAGAAVGFAVSVGFGASNYIENGRLKADNSELNTETDAIRAKMKKMEEDSFGNSLKSARNASEAKLASKAVGEMYAIQNYTQCMALGGSVLSQAGLYNRLCLGGSSRVNCQDFESIETMRVIASKACNEAIRELPKTTDDDPKRVENSKIVKKMIDGVKIEPPKGMKCDSSKKPDSEDLFEGLIKPRKEAITL